MQQIAIAMIVCVGMCLSAGAQNLVVNPGFDTDLAGWTNNSERMDWVGSDGHGALGCVEIGDTGNNGASIGIYQEIVITGNGTYDVSGWARLPAGSASRGVRFWIYWFDDLGDFISSTGTCGPFLSVGGPWTEVNCQWTSPANAANALVWVAVHMASSGTVESVARWDDISVTEVPLFADDFESGDTGAWSSTQP